ncbi:MAG: hypothetical protein AAB834_08280 [Patescibacteria group bacterium]
MAEHFDDSSYPQFFNTIEQNREAVAVASNTLDLMAENAYASIRYQGAFLTELILKRPNGLVSPLYSDRAEGLDKAKLTASHAMMPVGPYDGAGGNTASLGGARIG